MDNPAFGITKSAQAVWKDLYSEGNIRIVVGSDIDTVISKADARLILSNYRHIPVEKIDECDVAMDYLCGKTVRQVRDFLLKVTLQESYHILREFAHGDSDPRDRRDTFDEYDPMSEPDTDPEDDTHTMASSTASSCWVAFGANTHKNTWSNWSQDTTSTMKSRNGESTDTLALPGGSLALSDGKSKNLSIMSSISEMSEMTDMSDISAAPSRVSHTSWGGSARPTFIVKGEPPMEELKEEVELFDEVIPENSPIGGSSSSDAHSVVSSASYEELEQSLGKDNVDSLIDRCVASLNMPNVSNDEIETFPDM